jgi:hypothetical protein
MLADEGITTIEDLLKRAQEQSEEINESESEAEISSRAVRQYLLGVGCTSAHGDAIAGEVARVASNDARAGWDAEDDTCAMEALDGMV